MRHRRRRRRQQRRQLQWQKGARNEWPARWAATRASWRPRSPGEGAAPACSLEPEDGAAKSAAPARPNEAGRAAKLFLSPSPSPASLSLSAFRLLLAAFRRRRRARANDGPRLRDRLAARMGRARAIALARWRRRAAPRGPLWRGPLCLWAGLFGGGGGLRQPTGASWHKVAGDVGLMIARPAGRWQCAQLIASRASACEPPQTGLAWGAPSKQVAAGAPQTLGLVCGLGEAKQTGGAGRSRARAICRTPSARTPPAAGPTNQLASFWGPAGMGERASGPTSARLGLAGRPARQASRLNCQLARAGTEMAPGAPAKRARRPGLDGGRG